METNETITTDPWHIQKDYKKEMEKFCNDLQSHCRQNKVDYTMLSTNKPIELALFDYLLKHLKGKNYIGPKILMGRSLGSVS